MSKAKATYIFATRNDLEPGIKEIEARRDLKYVLMGSFDSPNIEVTHSALEIADLGIATKGDNVHENSYLVTDAADQVEIREVPQRRGGIRYIVDGMANPRSIIFRPGGVFTNICIIRGEIGTNAADRSSVDLYKDFVAQTTKGFKKVKMYFIGPEAEKLSRGRMRLTHSVHAPSDTDLKLS